MSLGQEVATLTASRPWRGLWHQWTVFLPVVSVGPLLIFIGWRVSDSQYLSDLLLQVGSTFLLLLPLLLFERGLERRINKISEEVVRLRFYGQPIQTEMKKQLDDEIVRFRDYLKRAEAWLPAPLSGVEITPEQGDYADLDETTKRIVAGPGSLADGDVVAHVYAHHFLQSSKSYNQQIKSFAFYGLEALHERRGVHELLWFGLKPYGGVFIYPYGLRYPPIQLRVNNAGQLMVFGHWTQFEAVAHHEGFAELARLLGQEHTGGSRSVSAESLPLDQLWRAVLECAEAINEHG